MLPVTCLHPEMSLGAYFRSVFAMHGYWRACVEPMGTGRRACVEPMGTGEPVLSLWVLESLC